MKISGLGAQNSVTNHQSFKANILMTKNAEDVIVNQMVSLYKSCKVKNDETALREYFKGKKIFNIKDAQNTIKDFKNAFKEVTKEIEGTFGFTIKKNTANKIETYYKPKNTAKFMKQGGNGPFSSSLILPFDSYDAGIPFDRSVRVMLKKIMLILEDNKINNEKVSKLHDKLLSAQMIRENEARGDYKIVTKSVATETPNKLNKPDNKPKIPLNNTKGYKDAVGKLFKN